MKKLILFLFLLFPVLVASASTNYCIDHGYYLLTIGYPKVWEIYDSHIQGSVCDRGGTISAGVDLPPGAGNYDRKFTYYVLPGATILLKQRSCTTVECTLTVKYQKPMPSDNLNICCGGLGFETHCDPCAF